MIKQALFAGIIASAFTASAFCQSVVSVNFGSGYLDGDLIGQNGWALTGTTPGNKINIVSGAAILTAGQTGEDAYKAFETAVPATSGTSLLTTINFSITSATAGGDYFFHLSNPAGTASNFYQRLFVKSSGEGFVLGLLDTGGTGSATTYGITELALNTSYEISIVWNFIAGSDNDTFSLSVNGMHYLDHTWTSKTVPEPTSLAAINLRQGGTNTTPGVSVTGISVVAVPEPGTVALLGLGFGAALFGVRRRRV